jgi:hypothetical protein
MVTKVYRVSKMTKVSSPTPREWAARILAPNAVPKAQWGAVGELGKLADLEGRVSLSDEGIESAASYLGVDRDDFIARVHELVAARWLAPLQVTEGGLGTHLRTPG